MDREKCISICNELLRGERSAIETYDQAIEKFRGENEVGRLRTIKADHTKSAKTLESNIVRMGGKPAEDSGVWGVFAKMVEGSAKLFGEQAALTALQKGEQYGKTQYHEALEDKDVMPECRQMIADELLPRQVMHIKQLDSLLEA
jgi:uncharacterized protein (TIGR02284 family)